MQAKTFCRPWSLFTKVAIFSETTDMKKLFGSPLAYNVTLGLSYQNQYSGFC